MPSLPRPLGIFTLLLIGTLLVVVGWRALGPRPATPATSELVLPVPTEMAPRPPILLRSPPDNGQPALAWQRFLAADGSPREDVGALQDMVATFVQLVPPPRRPALGFNEDLARLLTEAEFMGDAALPRTHPALRDGQLIDRWGRPWLVHPLAADLIQVRSAGPDGKFFTSDDLVAPKDSSER